MKQSTWFLALILLPVFAHGITEGAEWPMDPFKPNIQDKPSLQRGARLFVNYCIGCHSLKFQRYERTADDLEIPHEIFMANLVFTDQKIGSLITTALPTEASKAWFGAAPPDLTLVSKLRGGEWVYNYLKAFYVDAARPFGVNNKVFPNVAMPHALLELQGTPVPSCRQVPKIAENSGEMRDPLIPGVAITEEKCGFIDVVEGTGRMTAKEFDQAVYDVANFLYYVGEPARAHRERLGVYVLLFLVVLYVFTALLGREYNKEVH
jgi:ubiquinol-cytochrome c reductase cytochrome b subunit